MCLSFDESYEKAKKYLELLDRPDEELNEMTEDDITHFVVVPILRDALGWKPVENMHCQSYKKNQLEDRSCSGYIDIELNDDNYSLFIEAKGLDAVQQELDGEAKKRGQLKPEFCIVTNGMIWNVYHIEYGESEESEAIPALIVSINLLNDETINGEDNKIYEYAKLYSLLRPGTLLSMLNKYKIVYDQIMEERHAQRKSSQQDIFKECFASLELGQGYYRILKDELRRQFNPEVVKFMFDGMEDLYGAIIINKAKTIMELRPLKLKISNNGGVSIVDYSIFGSDIEKESAIKYMSIFEQKRDIEYHNIRELLDDIFKNTIGLARNYYKNQWHIRKYEEIPLSDIEDLNE